MNVNELNNLKADFIKDYIDKSLNRLLDLRNAIDKAETSQEMERLVIAEKSYCKTFYNSLMPEAV